MPITLYSQPGIYNILDYGAIPGGSMSDYMQAQANVAAIQAAINQAIVDTTCETSNLYGGIILIPSNDTVPSQSRTDGDGAIYYLSQTEGGTGPLFSINGSNTCSLPLLFLGTSTASRLYMLPTNSDMDIDNEVPMFEINNATTDDTDVGGITFQDLWFEYDFSLKSLADYAIEALGSQNVRLFRCVLNNVPGGVYIVNTSQFSMIDCTGLLDKRLNGTMLTIGDTGEPGSGSFNAYVAGCQFRVGTGAGDAGKTTTGLMLGACDILRVSDCRFDGFTNGVVFKPSFTTQDLAFTNVSFVGTDTQVTMTPAAGNKIQGVTFTNCFFENNTAASTDPAVLLEPQSGAGNSVIDGVRFISCVCTGNPAVGLELVGGQNIEILGGLYSSNSVSNQTSSGYPAIFLNGAGANIRIVGASVASAAFGEGSQPFGIEITQWQNALISDCDVTGYTGTGFAPFKFSSPGAGLEIVNCAGYNDQGKGLAMAFLPVSATFSSESLGYYGPVVFYIQASNVTEVQVNGINTGLLSGTFMLPPGAVKIKITYSATPDVVAIGM